jgi:DNA polymerase-3 subunit beta
MELTVRREDLAKGLGRSQSVVERRTSMPILSNVLLEAEGEKLKISATDLETSFIGEYPARISRPGRLTVPARKLFEIVKELPVDELYLKEKENSYLHLSGGRANFELVGMAPDEFPQLPEATGLPELKLEADTLAEMIEKTYFSISQEDTRFNLAGLFVEKRQTDDEQSLRFVSTDGHRLSIVDRAIEGIEDFNMEQGVIIPRKAVAEIRKLAEEGEELTLGLNQELGVVRKDEVILILRMQEGTFPDYKVVIPKNIKKHVLVNRRGFGDMLKRVSILAQDRFHGVRFDFKPGLLEVVSQNPDLGEAREALEADYSGEGFHLGFNARYFLDLCGAMHSEDITLSFVDEQSPCMIKGEGDPGFLSVIMPMRL